MSASTKQHIEFLLSLSEHTGRPPRDCEVAASLLLRHGRTHKRLQEMFCSVDLGADEPRYLRQCERLRERITKVAASLGCTVRFGGDPRGATIKLVLPDGYTDDWGKIGFCVPTS